MMLALMLFELLLRFEDEDAFEKVVGDFSFEPAVKFASFTCARSVVLSSS